MAKKKSPAAAAAPFDADVLIIGAGMMGSILAKELTAKDPDVRVLVVEAGSATSVTAEGYASYVRRFHGALLKIPNSPYPDSPYAPAPTVLQFNQIPKGTIDAAGYYVQRGPLPYSSEFDRTAGGTTNHWLGQTPRMVPNDLRLKSAYGVGLDWPFGYETLRPYYERAEFELGVAGDAADQRIPGADPAKTYGDYRFPMQAIPRSFADQSTSPAIKAAKLDPKKFPPSKYPAALDVVTMPQARNSLPNPGYVNPETGARGYQPVGGADNPTSGLRCEGNSNCVPICPVQAKYNALKSLRAAQKSGRVTVLTQTVAKLVEWDQENGRITGIVCQGYASSPDANTRTLRARTYVLASHTVENTKLLLNSGVPNTSDQLGRNLMDNVTMLAWGLAPRPLGAYRGPGSTSNIPSFRDGEFRREHAAFVLPLDNFGWLWPAYGPDAQVSELMSAGWPLRPPGSQTKRPEIPPERMFGRTLRACAGNAISRQFFIHFEMEQLPRASNRITVDPGYCDALGVPRPVFNYNLSDYEKRTFPKAREFCAELFPQMGVEDFSADYASSAGYFEYPEQPAKARQGYTFYGAGHIVGTCRLGTTPKNSCLNDQLRSWDHPNLFVVGGAAMPTIGTGNPSITMAALAYRAADAIRKDLAT